MQFTDTSAYRRRRAGFAPVIPTDEQGRVLPLPKAGTPAYDLGAYGTTLASGLLASSSGIPALVTAVLPVFALLVGIAMLPRVARKFGIRR